MIPTQPFGRTAHYSTRIIFGAAAFSRVTQDEADQTMETVLRYGINHIDTAASYGEAEPPPGALDGAPPPALLPGHQDRRAHLRRAREQIRAPWSACASPR